MKRLLWVLFALLGSLSTGMAANAGPSAAPVTVTVDRSVSAGVSRFEAGVTHTQYSLDVGGADPQAVARAKTLLEGACRYQVQSIMGWGTLNPEPSPGVYQWDTLDSRLRLIRSMGATPVITLCAAPDWMKGGQAGQTDFSKIEVAPLPEHYGDFAALAAQVARRYPDVTHFQVWNEFKGLWDSSHNNWDYVHYTELYNKVYDALKAVNPKIQVGGPYLVIEGTGSKTGGWETEAPIRARQWEVLNYWLTHKHGADFIVLDRGLITYQDKTPYSEAQKAGLTHWFGDIARQVRARTNLPLWWAEFYGAGDTPAAVAAIHASTMLHMLKGGTSVALLWGPMEEHNVDYNNALFSDVRQPGGGQPTPNYAIFQVFHTDFGPGTKLVKAVSSSPDVEALASAKKTLLINKRSVPISIRLNGHPLTLAADAVWVTATPPALK